MRQVGAALLMYANANKGFMPAGFQVGEPFNSPVVNNATGPIYWWMRLQSQKYLPGIDDPRKSALICPDDVEPFQAHEYPGIKSLLCSYGQNPYMSVAVDVKPYGGPFPGRAPLGVCDWYGHKQPRATSLKNSSEKILMAEVRWGWIANWFQPNTWEGAQALSEWFDWDWYRHHAKSGNKKKGRINVLYLDGHVGAIMQGVDAPGIYTNQITSAADWIVGPSASKKGQMQWGYLPPVP
jgi:prepilin-type processing-associated H-X9-DG protein